MRTDIYFGFNPFSKFIGIISLLVYFILIVKLLNVYEL